MAALRIRLLGSASLLVGVAALALSPPAARANPEGGTVVAGTATVSSPAPGAVQIDQRSQKAIIDWRSFSIAPGERTSFNQPGASAITLNRVRGGDPSQILGQLTSNGQVWLLNPNGVVFGKAARVDVAGLLATTLNISNRDFLTGAYNFAASSGAPATIANEGQITVRDAGLAALVAPGVANSGVIEARLGQIQLSAANGFTVDFFGDGKVNFLLSGQVTGVPSTSSTATVSNSGSLIADGGRIVLSTNVAKSVVDRAINVDGYIQAQSISARNGVIELDGGEEGQVVVAGTLDVGGETPGAAGGTATVTGKEVRLASTARVSASGDAGGGTVLLGGDFHGAGSLAHAAKTVIEGGAVISADAISTGNGGQVVAWSDDQTLFFGKITARGGASTGNGGTAEVSSHQLLAFSGEVDLRAKAGAAGTLLLDPQNVTITADGDAPSVPLVLAGEIQFDPVIASSTLSVTTLQTALDLANVTVTTGTSGSQDGDIIVVTGVPWASDHSLTLSAHRNLIINDSFANVGAGSLNLRADADGTGVGTVTFNGTAAVNYSHSTGSISLFYNPAGGYAAPTDYSAHLIENANVAGQVQTYMLVNSLSNLRALSNNLSGTYALGRDIDASASSGTPFVPLGTDQTPFAGILDGVDHTISNLTIDTTGDRVAPFAVNTGAIRNVHLTSEMVSASRPGDNWTYAAGLVAVNAGLLVNDSVAGSISLATNSGRYLVVGGLVASNSGSISRSSSSASVTGGPGGECCAAYTVGGLVGSNYGQISFSSATGAVVGAGGDIGGLAGYSHGSIDQSFATGPVRSTGITGGLVGWNQGGSISNSYARGSVDGGPGLAGGLVELLDLGGTISSSYSTGLVTGVSTGGLVDRVGYGGGIVINSYWNTDTSGQLVSAGGIGLTTAQLKSGLPAGFDPSVWATDPAVNNGYPYLKSRVAVATPTPTHIAFGAPAASWLLVQNATAKPLYASKYGDKMGDLTFVIDGGTTKVLTAYYDG